MPEDSGPIQIIRNWDDTYRVLFHGRKVRDFLANRWVAESFAVQWAEDHKNEVW